MTLRALRIAVFVLISACPFMASPTYAKTYPQDLPTKMNPEIVTGGVSDQSEAQINYIQHHYSVKITFVGIGGIYLDSINVTIDDKYQNRIINTTTDGPILLADLSPGRYTVTAELEGHTIKQTIQANKTGLRQYTLRFPIGE
ncbi:MAG: hypothetical protein SFW65_08420 [Alphaproteobacteria bacterium]|nr:hypothetical protein [Alphaproteobacteria bacterium]